MRTIALYTTLFVLIAGFIILFSTNSGPDLYVDSAASIHRHPPKGHGPPQSSPFKSGGQFEFDYKRDGRNYGLTEEQCNIAFPDLYHEIDRAVQHRKDKWGKITPDETEVEWRGDGMVKAMIHDNQLYILNAFGVWDHNHRPRTVATMHALNRAISAYAGQLPDIEFSFGVHDAALHNEFGNHTTWAYTRLPHQEKLWLMPDFGMWAWPDVGLRSYPQLQEVLEYEEDEFVDKIPKLVWRGSLNVGSPEVRHGLVDHSKGKSWSDVQVLHWDNSTDIEERLLTMTDHCRYMFVAQTEGNTYSGRLKYLLNCHSILLSHELKWVELYHHLMKSKGPDQNYIRTKRDFRDLPSKMNKLSNPANFAETQKIADNARRTFRERYLTPAAEACYWRALIRAWGSMMDFKPDFWQEVEEFDKVSQKIRKKKKPRGAPFEAYAVMEEVDWTIPAKARKICIQD